jgi:hypothetical protein
MGYSETNEKRNDEIPSTLKYTVVASLKVSSLNSPEETEEYDDD